MLKSESVLSKPFIIIFAALALFISCGHCRADEKSKPAPIMPVSEIKPDMKGYGLTVMSGAEPAKFDVRIIGVLRKTNAGGDMIIAEITGPPEVVHTGPAAGMSGSPIYIGGRMIGALAWSFPFSKDPICGITPIEDMLLLMKADTGKARKAEAPSPAPEAKTVLAAINGYSDNQTTETSVPAAPVFKRIAFNIPGFAQGELTPIATPVVTSGFTDSSRELLKDMLERQTMSPMSIGGSGAEGETPNPAADDLRPGGVLSVPLITGDFMAGIFGTVTWRDGDDILAFGHPMFSQGPIEVPMGGGSVVHVLANSYNSFKMVNFAHTVGSVVLDGQFAIRGRMGKESPMTPATITVTDSDTGRSGTFHIKAARYKTLTYGLISRSIGNVIARISGDGVDGTLTVDFKGKLLGIDKPVEFRDVYYSPEIAYIDPLDRLSLLVNNPFRELEIESCDVKVTVDHVQRTAILAAVTISQNKFTPGGKFTARVELKNFDGKTEMKQVEISLPEDAPPGQYKLVALGGSGLSLRDTPPETFEQYYDDALARLPLNSFVIGVLYPEKVPAMRGETLSGAPATLRDTLLSGTFSGVVPVDRIDKHVVKTDAIITGQSGTTFTVEKKNQ